MMISCQTYQYEFIVMQTIANLSHKINEEAELATKDKSQGQAKTCAYHAMTCMIDAWQIGVTTEELQDLASVAWKAAAETQSYHARHAGQHCARICDEVRRLIKFFWLIKLFLFFCPSRYIQNWSWLPNKSSNCQIHEGMKNWAVR